MRLTLARRVCADCGATTALCLWPWQGRLLVTSHGICRRCLARLVPALVREGGSP